MNRTYEDLKHWKIRKDENILKAIREEKEYSVMNISNFKASKKSNDIFNEVALKKWKLERQEEIHPNIWPVLVKI